MHDLEWVTGPCWASVSCGWSWALTLKEHCENFINQAWRQLRRELRLKWASGSGSPAGIPRDWQLDWIPQLGDPGAGRTLSVSQCWRGGRLCNSQLVLFSTTFHQEIVKQGAIGSLVWPACIRPCAERVCQGERGALAALHCPFRAVAPMGLAAGRQVGPTEPLGQFATPSPVAVENSNVVHAVSPQVTGFRRGEGGKKSMSNHAGSPSSRLPASHFHNPATNVFSPINL